MSIKDERINEFESFCRRERCPYSIVGEVTKDFRLKVFDSEFDNYPIDIPLDLIFGKILEKSKTFNTKRKPSKSLQLENLDLNKLACKVLRHPSVASKNFLITIADRSITGLIHRDQLVGPWQDPVSDNALTLAGFYVNNGEAMSLGEKSPCAVLDLSSPEPES